MSEKAIWTCLLSVTGNAYAAAGIMGNLCAESSLRPDSTLRININHQAT